MDLCSAGICPTSENWWRSGKLLPGLDLPNPCPERWIVSLQGRPMHSRPPPRLPEGNPPPDLREGSQRHIPRPASAKPQSGKIPAPPLKKSGGRENSCRANPGPTWASCSPGHSLESRISLLGNRISLCGTEFPSWKQDFPSRSICQDFEGTFQNGFGLRASKQPCACPRASL